MSEEQRVREANARFYAAMNSLDINEMDQVWAHDATAACVHPGREVLIGYEIIHESWAAIFSSTTSMSIIANDEYVTVAADAAWVACTETISLMLEEELVVASAQATNIFRRIGGEWRIVVHHASPIPYSAPQEEWPELIN